MLPLLYHTHHLLNPEDIPFWLDLAAHNPDPLLELGCGTGRVLFPLAQAGHDAWGLDYDFEMLSFLRSNLPAGLLPRLRVLQADFTHFRLATRFGLILLPCNTFSTLSAEDRRSTLECIHRHLLPSGLFAVSMPNPELLKRLPPSGEPEVEEVFFHPISGEPVQVLSAWERTQQFFITYWHYDHLLPDGNLQRLSIQQKHNLLPAQAYLDEIYGAGFASMVVFGDYDHSPHHRNSSYLIIVARL